MAFGRRILLHFIFFTFFSTLQCDYQDFGSCRFEDPMSQCGYIQPSSNDFNWTNSFIDGSYVMLADAANHPVGSTAKLITPKIKLQETHCVTFDVFQPKEETGDFGLNSTVLPVTTSTVLNVYLQDNWVKNQKQSIWNSSNLTKNKWETVQLALTPKAYKLVFEASIRDSSGAGLVAIDNVLVSPSTCESAPHFLRLASKGVNLKQNTTLRCLLFGHSGPNTYVVLQKSTGETIYPFVKEVKSDHLSATFAFSDVTLSANGSYRCLSGNLTQVGVSNYAPFLVKVPPSPKRGPQVVKPGATNFVIQLNAEEYTGDGPIVQKTLIYRPVNGSWSDVHPTNTKVYELWHLQPDTEYDLAVTLVRPGDGGDGPPGPTLRKKTKCGPPTSAVQRVGFNPKNTSIRVFWDAPDFSITQCHNFAFVVKYRLYSEPTAASPITNYKIKRVEKNTSVDIDGLSPYTKYIIKVELTNAADEGSRETGDYTVQTLEGLPGPLSRDSFNVVGTNQTAITVSWVEPQQPNGVVQKYEISYYGKDTFDPNFNATSDKGFYEVKGDERRLVLGPLHPGTSYAISIRAKTSAGPGPSIDLAEKTEIAPPTLPKYPPPSLDPEETNITVTPTSIEISIIPAQSFGAPITGYYVIVVDDTPKPSNGGRTETLKSKKKSESRKGKGRRKKKSRNKRSVNVSWLSRWKRQSVVNDNDNDVTTDNDMSGCYDTPITYDEAAKNNQSHYASAKLRPEEVTQEMKFVVGGGSPSNGFDNPPLDPNKDYKIYIRVESEADGKTTVSCVLVALKAHAPPTTPAPLPPTTTTPDKQGGNVGGETTSPADPGLVEPSEQDRTLMYAGIGGAVAGILVIVIIIILLVMRRKHRKQVHKDEVVNPFEVRMMLSDMSSPAHTLLPMSNQGNENSDRQALMPDVVGYEHQDFLDKSSEGGTAAGGYGTASNNERFAVRVDDFHVHVSQMKASGGYGFRDEFSAFPDGPTAPWTVAASTLNKGRNRYGNIMAYDHSRVVLDPPDGHEEEFESDYINASYVNGYKFPSMYIATQAPSEETTSDFWWMVWQEKSNVVVMLTNLVEMGKRKCHKYWPDDRGLYGTVEVSLNNEERLADCVVRTFILQQVDGYDVREIKLFHFTAWPDHGVPSRPTNLLTFIRKIKSNEPQGQGPTIVHCSAGSGRTGCFMVIDMMLDMARDEEIVDIHNTVRDLRARRVNMVQTEEQYVFIHEAVLEALLCGETLVMAQNLVQHYDDLITVDPQTHFAPIQEEFETLNVITPKLTEDECSVARLPRNRGSNRFMDVLPADRHLAYLYTPNSQDRDNNYINAVYLDSYSRKNSFLVTQMPLPSTVVDIWRLIYDHNCTSIVMMNDISEHDQTCCQYWPDVGSAIFGPFTVELLTKDDEVEVVTRLFKLQNVNKAGEPYRLVQQFQLTNWPAAQPVPYSRNSVLRIIHLVNAWQAECTRNGDPGKTLVHCVAGAGRSGTFVSCFNMCEQLQREQAVDVFNIVQRQRNVRPQLVETLEQYRFCYEVGIEFAQR